MTASCGPNPYFVLAKSNWRAASVCSIAHDGRTAGQRAATPVALGVTLTSDARTSRCLFQRSFARRRGTTGGWFADHSGKRCEAHDGISGGDCQNEAEQFRRLAEEAREVRDHHREALETIRQERERLRDTAETARAASEEARGAAEAARQAVVDAVRATAETLNVTFEQMKVVEEMRRTLREIRDVNKLVSN